MSEPGTHAREVAATERTLADIARGLATLTNDLEEQASHLNAARFHDERADVHERVANHLDAN
jgi:hypothetical protein